MPTTTWLPWVIPTVFFPSTISVCPLFSSSVNILSVSLLIASTPLPALSNCSSFCLYSLVLICVITSGVLLARTTLIAGILRRISSSNVWLSTLLVSLRTLLTCSCITTFLYALPRRCDLLALLRLQCSRVHCVP